MGLLPPSPSRGSSSTAFVVGMVLSGVVDNMLTMVRSYRRRNVSPHLHKDDFALWMLLISGIMAVDACECAQNQSILLIGGHYLFEGE